MDPSLFDEALCRTVREAVARVLARMRRELPHVGGEVASWAASLTRGEEPERYFLHPEAFPIFFFPWAMERTLTGQIDLRRQALLADAQVHGYYFVRMIDNVMDGEAGPEVQLLPALAHLHHEFERVYARLFSPEHPFWEAFGAHWRAGAIAAIRDQGLEQPDEAAFCEIAGRKVCAGKLPLAAVAHLCGRADALPTWERLYDRFGCWHQLQDDLFDWSKDSGDGLSTWFLAEAERRRGSDESLADWVSREGFAWGLSVLGEWMQGLRQSADDAGSAELAAYFAARDRRLAARAGELEADVDRLSRLFGIISGDLG